MDHEPQKTVESAARALWARDAAANALGMALLELRPGYSRMQMTIRGDMVNMHGTAHGGMIFTLADCAFAFACNSHDKAAVASNCSIDFLRPAHQGDTLTATCIEQAILGRNGVYDTRVENQKGELIALFRGKSTQVRAASNKAHE